MEPNTTLNEKWLVRIIGTKHSLCIKIGRLSFDVGWYTGEPFTALDIQMVRLDESLWTLCQLQIARFMFGIYWEIDMEEAQKRRAR